VIRTTSQRQLKPHGGARIAAARAHAAGDRRVELTSVNLNRYQSLDSPVTTLHV